MVSFYSEQEDRIQKACGASRKNPERKITDLAEEFDVPYHALRNRLKGRKSLIDVGGKNKKLSERQELIIIRFVKVLESFGIEPRPRFLHGIANRVLKNDHADPTSPAPSVGIHWSRRFIERRPELHVEKATPLAAERKRTHDPDSLRDWFLRLQRTIQEYGVVDNDIYNMDETGYRIGCGRSQLVVSTKPGTRKYLMDPDNRQHITSIECISATGYVLPSMIILPGAQIIHNWILSELDPTTVLAVSDTGYSNDDIQMDWIRHFNEHTKARTHGAKRLLLIDGVNSHMEYDFIEYCWDENIIPFAFIPHTTHLCQPLDVKCFQPLKHYHSEAIDRAVRTGDAEFSKIEFLAAFQNFRRQAFTLPTVLSAFRETGIVPWDPQKVLDKIQRPQTPPQEQQPRLHPQETPEKAKHIAAAGELIAEAISKRPNLSPLDQWILKFIKGALIRNSIATLTEDLLDRTQLAEEARDRRKKVGRKVIQKGGVIKVGEARRRINWRENYSLSPMRKRYKKMPARIRKGYQGVMRQLKFRLENV